MLTRRAFIAGTVALSATTTHAHEVRTSIPKPPPGRVVPHGEVHVHVPYGYTEADALKIFELIMEAAEEKAQELEGLFHYTLHGVEHHPLSENPTKAGPQA
jgi:hypothetical protein